MYNRWNVFPQVITERRGSSMRRRCRTRSGCNGCGNEVRIELAGDATVLMRSVVANNVTPVGWPPFREALAKVIELKIPVFV
jgi:hypothetical protein